MAKKKILVLTSTFPRWRNDTTPPFVFELEKRMVKDFEIHVLAPHFKGAKRFERLEGLKIHRFQYFWPAKLQKLCYEGGILPNLKKNKFLYIQAITLMIFELVSAIRIARKEKINLIHAHWIIPQGIIAVMLKNMFKIPYIITVHGSDAYGLENGFLKKIKQVILTEAKSITVVSNEIKDKLEKDFKNLKIDTISMGVDSNQFNPNRYDPKIKDEYSISGPFLLFVGRLTEVKGVKYLIKAIPLIVKKNPKVKLLIIGSGTLENELKELTHRLKLDKYIIFIGALTNSDLPKYYATADIFVGPSIKTKGGDREGFGLTFVEAAFSNCIPVGTKIGGIPNIIQNNKTGFMVREKNSQSIAKTVIRLLEDEKLRFNIKNNLRTILVPKYRWETVTQKYLNLFRK